MRFPTDGEDLTGKVCVCSIGRLGIVTHFNEDLKAWCGMGVDGNGTWRSGNPGVMFESLQEYCAVLNERFDGRLSANS